MILGIKKWLRSWKSSLPRIELVAESSGSNPTGGAINEMEMVLWPLTAAIQLSLADLTAYVRAWWCPQKATSVFRHRVCQRHQRNIHKEVLIPIDNFSLAVKPELHWVSQRIPFDCLRACLQTCRVSFGTYSLQVTNLQRSKTVLSPFLDIDVQCTPLDLS